MAFVAPVAGALFGGLLTGWAGWGLSVGWLVGSWLFGPKTDQKNQVFDPGAEEMPLFNQALRGSTMPILFGTNRVASQVVWQKNFKTIRHESKKGGGGGKGGGSGLGGKGGGAETSNVTYEYKWDLMFHVGMSDVQLGLFGGWLNVERLNDATLLSIINNESSAFTLFTSDTDRPSNAELSFVEGFFAGCGPTGDATFENWSHFESEEGGPYRWPYTAYIGFKQLNLGSSARIPQLSWEIGEGGMYLESDVGGSNIRSPGSGSFPNLYQSGMSQPFIGQDGKQYMFHGGGGASNVAFSIYNLTDEEWLDSFFSDTEMQVLMIFSGYLASGWSATKAISTFNCGGGVYGVIYNTDNADGRYFVATMHSTATFNYIHHSMMFTVNKLGQLSFVGSYTGSSGLEPSQILSGPCTIYNHGAATDSDPQFIVVNYNGYQRLVQIPSIDGYKAGTTYDTAGDIALFDTFEGSESPGSDAHDGLVFRGSSNFQTALSVNDPPNQYGVNQYFNTPNTTYLAEGIWCEEQSWFILPKLTISELGLPIWTNYFCFHFGYAKLRYMQVIGSGFDTTSTNIYNEVGLEPIIIGAEFSVGNYPTFIDDGMVDISDKFVDTDGNTYVMDDVDGYGPVTTSRYPNAGIHPAQVNAIASGVAAGASAVLFSKAGYDDSVNPHPDLNVYGTDSWAWVEVYIWNPYTQKAVNYGHITGPMGDKASDWLESSPSQWRPESIRTYYVESRGVAALVFEEGGVGFSYAGYSEIGTIQIGGGVDITPPVIIYRILTSEVYGLGYTAADIDATSYGLAVQYCEAEEIKVSVQYRREESALQVIDDLLSLYGGFLIDSNGKIKFGLQEFTSSPIRTIDNEHLVIQNEGEAPVKVTKGARQDTYNKIKVNYFDRDLEYRQNFIELADEVDMDLHGVRAQEYPAKYVMKEKTANRIAARALWGNLYARDIYEFSLGPKDADLEPGDVITLVDSFNNKLSTGKQVRIVEWQETEPLIFRARAVDEIEYINASTLDVGSATEAPSKNSLFGPAAPPAYIGMYELPKEFQGADAKLFVGYRQQNAAMGARLYLSTDGVTYSQMDDIQPYIISGILAEGLPNRDPGYVEENVEIYLMPDTRSGAFDTDNATLFYCQTFDLEDANAAGRAIGTSMLWINSEMCAYEGLTLLGQNYYRIDKLYRGWGGTHIQGHSSGDTWWRHGGGVFAQTLNQDKVGNIVYYKVQPYNFAGVGYNVSSIDARTYQVQGVYWKPQNPGALRTYVQSPGSYLTVQSEDLNFITKKQVLSGGSPVQIEWPDTSRDSGYGALGYNYLSYGGFAADTTSHQYRVEVYSSDGTTVVRCTTVSTLAFLYTVDNNSTDFNGWAGSFSVKVTPYNTYGDALRSRTKVLELFE